MPRPMKLRGLTEPKEIRMKVPGVGLPRDVLRVSLETRDPALIRARQAMLRDLYQHGRYALLRARHDERVTTQRLHLAHKAGTDALVALERELAGGLLAPLVAQWERAYRGKDRARTFERVRRFLAAHGGAQATTACLTAANVEQHLASLTNAQGRKNRKAPPVAAPSPRQGFRVRTATCAVCRAPFEVRASGTLPTRCPAHRTKGAAAATRPASNATKNRHRGTLSALCTWLVTHGHLAVHPITQKRVQKYDEPDGRMPPPFSADDYRAYLDAVSNDTEHGAALRVFFLLLLHTGADVGEVSTRTALHVDLGRTVPRVEFKRTKIKKAKTRWVPLPAPVAAALRAHLAATRATGEQLLFPMLTEAVWRAAHARGQAATGRPSLRIKDLRHLAAIAWARAGIRIDVIADLLGHTRLEMTRVYVKHMPDTTEEADIAAGSLAQLAGPSGVTPIASARREA